MRNILVFPDGSEQDFMYPPNREVDVGVELQATMADGSIHVFKVSTIKPEAKRILYFLSY